MDRGLPSLQECLSKDIGIEIPGYLAMLKSSLMCCTNFGFYFSCWHSFCWHVNGALKVTWCQHKCVYRQILTIQKHTDIIQLRNLQENIKSIWPVSPLHDILLHTTGDAILYFFPYIMSYFFHINRITLSSELN